MLADLVFLIAMTMLMIFLTIAIMKATDSEHNNKVKNIVAFVSGVTTGIAITILCRLLAT